MKLTITIITIIINSLIFAQVGIERNVFSTESAILEFADEGNKGIILPHVNDEATLLSNAVPGTWYFDTAQNKVKFITDAVVDMSVKPIENTANNFDASQAYYANFSENLPPNAQGTVIGAANTGAPGALILDTKNKALSLPVTTDYSLILDPTHGMVVYDSTLESICVFDGEKWTFWARN